MKLVRGYAPLPVFNPLAQLERELDQVFGNVAGTGCPTTPVWTPPTDVREDEKQFVFSVELPGVRREDVQVSLDEGVLSLSGERRGENPTEPTPGQVRLRERFVGRFTRRFALGTAVATEGVRASLRDGVLVVTVPKAEVAKPKSVEVTAE